LLGEAIKGGKTLGRANPTRKKDKKKALERGRGTQFKKGERGADRDTDNLIHGEWRQFIVGETGKEKRVPWKSKKVGLREEEQCRGKEQGGLEGKEGGSESQYPLFNRTQKSGTEEGENGKAANFVTEKEKTGTAIVMDRKELGEEPSGVRRSCNISLASGGKGGGKKKTTWG